MYSSKFPTVVLQNSDKLLCEVCDLRFDSQKKRDFHFGAKKHTAVSKALARCLLGYLPDKRITCLDEMFYNSNKKGTFIGMQYLRNYKGIGMNVSCLLCRVECRKIYPHLLSMKHKQNYICREFSFLIKDVENLSFGNVKKISEALEEVEGLQSFTYAVKNQRSKSLPECFSASNSSSRQILNKLVERLLMCGIPLKVPYERRNYNRMLPEQTKKKRFIHPRVLSKPYAVLKIASSQIKDKTDKRQMHRIDFTDTRRKKNAVSSLPRSHASTTNEKSVKRPLRFTPLAAFKRRKSELPHQHTREARSSLSRPFSVPFSLSDPSVGVPVRKNRHGHNSLQATKLPTTSNIPPMNDGMAHKRIPSLPSSHSERWTYQTTWPPAMGYFPSWPPAEHGYSYYSDQSVYGFANKSVYGQACAVSDFGKANDFQVQTWGQETVHVGAQHLHTLGMMGGSVSSLTGPTSLTSLKQDTTPRYGYNFADSKELFFKSSSPSGIISIVKQEPNLSKSLRDIPPPEGLTHNTSTSSRAQTSQSTNSDMPAKAASILSPHTLKILQGRDPESVKSILNRLSEYCPELQQVNIALLVEVLFETGAL